MFWSLVPTGQWNQANNSLKHAGIKDFNILIARKIKITIKICFNKRSVINRDMTEEEGAVDNKTRCIDDNIITFHLNRDIFSLKGTT